MRVLLWLPLGLVDSILPNEGFLIGDPLGMGGVVEWGRGEVGFRLLVGVDQVFDNGFLTGGIGCYNNNN